MNIIWKFARILPGAMIVWHLFLLVSYFPMALWEIFVIEVPWLILYTIAWLIMLRPNPMGYCYLALFLTVNIGWEIWISGLLLDEVRLFTYFLPGLFLVYLFFNRNRFGAKTPFSLLALALFGLLLAEATYVSVMHFQYKVMTEFGRWSVKDTGYSAETQGGARWCGTNALVSRFLVSPLDKMENRFALGRLDLETGKIVVIDQRGFGPICSDGGEWLSYFRKAEMSDKLKKNVREYLRYDIQTRTSEILLKYDSRGRNFDNFMAPSGDKLVFLDRKDDTLEVFPSREPQWPVYKWKISEDVRRFEGDWMPDGKTVLIKKSGDLFLAISTLDGKNIKEILLPAVHEESPYITDDYKIGPDGDYIYLRLKKTNRLYYYRLSNPESGWHLVGERAVYNYAVGPGGMMVFNGMPQGISYYLYLSGEKIATTGLWLFKPGTGETIRLTAGNDDLPSISPDGKTIAFFRGITDKITPPRESRNELMLLKRQ